MKRLILQKRFHVFVVAFVLSFASNVLARQDTPSQPSDTNTKKEKLKFDGTLEGKVVDENGKPIANADVYVFVLGATTYNSKGASTDDAGKFRLKNLPPGMYRVNASSPGYVMPQTDEGKQSEPKFYRSNEYVNITMVKGGVITGKVTDASGEPVVGVTIHAIRIQGNTSSLPGYIGFHFEKRTDDRGIYRIYGLVEGRYLIYAGRAQFQNEITAYDKDAMIYYPSSTRDAATTVNVRSGEETTGIDIRYRGERGFNISGTIKASGGFDTRWASIILSDPTSNAQIAYAQVMEQDGRRAFEFRGVSDGDYKLTASSSSEAGSYIGFLRVQVKGADVGGLEIKLAPLANISGKVVLNEDPKLNCESQTGGMLEEILLKVSRDKITDTTTRESYTETSTTANNQGAFALQGLLANTYRLQTQLPTEDWYIQSIARQKNQKPKETSVVSAIPELIALKEGEKITDLIINLSAGAASVRGRVTPKTEGAVVPANLRIYLIPTEKERADDTLRYAEVSSEADGTFSITNLAPGRYWIVARVVNEENANPRPLSWDATARAKLRKEAEAANIVLELKPCQQLKDFQFRF